MANMASERVSEELKVVWSVCATCFSIVILGIIAFLFAKHATRSDADPQAPDA
ncbi:MAG TPA: hypothetical protein PKL83_05670 [bacterium]|nr:hypothetical protein [bacterium]